jgi:hypothetical protein
MLMCLLRSISAIGGMTRRLRIGLSMTRSGQPRGHGETLRSLATSRLSSPLLSPFGEIDCKKLS